MMHWYLSHQADPRAVKLADRHYSRKSPGTGQFMPPGRMLILATLAGDAVWATSWPLPELVPYRADAWVCTIFRNESAILSSALICEAIAATRWKYGTPPVGGMVTFIDARKVTSRNPGYCFKRAGFTHTGYTKKRLHILQLLPQDMPAPAMPYGATYPLLEELRKEETTHAA